MNYYYALLESYDLLKKRKFKLSLREQGDEDPEAQAKTYVSQAQGTEGGLKAGIDVTSPDGQMGKVWKAVRSGKINFADNEEGQFYDEVTPGTGAGWENLVSFLSAKGTKGADEDEPGGGEEQVEDPKAVANVDTAQRVQDKLSNGMLSRDEDEMVEEEQRLFPGLDSDVATNFDLAQKLEQTSSEIPSEDIEEGLESFDVALDIVKKIHAGEPITTEELREIKEQVEVTSNGIKFGTIVLSYNEGMEGSEATTSNDLPTNVIDQINKQIEIHNGNCPHEDADSYKACHVPQFKDIDTFYDRKEGEEVNLARRGKMMEHTAVLYDLGRMAEDMRCLPESKISEQVPEPLGKSKDLETPEGTSEEECDVTDVDSCEKLDSAIECTYQRMLEQGVGLDVQQTFREGLCARGQTCLVQIPRDGIPPGDAAVVKSVIDFLASEGVDEETAKFIVERAASMGDQGSRALAFLVASARQFNTHTSELEMKSSEVFGGTGSDLKGQKTDVRRVVTAASGKTYIEQRKASMTPMEKKLEEAAKCTGEDMGWDALLKDEGNGNVRLDTEVKAMNSARSGRTKTGEGFTKVMSGMCKPKNAKQLKQDDAVAKAAKAGDAEAQQSLERQGLEDEFHQKNIDRIDACAKHHAKDKTKKEAPWGRHPKENGEKIGKPKTVKDVACEFQGKIDAEMATTNKVFRGQPVMDVTQDPPQPEDPQPDYHTAIIDDIWLESKGGKAADKKTQERAKLAAACVAAKQQGKPCLVSSPEGHALQRVEQDLEQIYISKQLNQTGEEDTGKIDADGNPITRPVYRTSAKDKLDPEAQAYLAFRLGLEGGSTEECQKDARGYSDGTQRTGCINPSIYGSIGLLFGGEAQITGGIYRGKRGNSWTLKSGDSTLAKAEFERGQMVSSVGVDAMSPMGESKLAGKGMERKPDNASVLYDLLAGQHKLLEKLIAQTT